MDRLLLEISVLLTVPYIQHQLYGKSKRCTPGPVFKDASQASQKVAFQKKCFFVLCDFFFLFFFLGF